MSVGQRLRQRREELGMSRQELARLLGVSVSAIGNYETGQNFMREDILVRLLHVLQVDPNYLYQDVYQSSDFHCSPTEMDMVKQYRELSVTAQRLVRALLQGLLTCQREAEELSGPAAQREIPLYESPAAAGYAAPVFGEDYDLIPVTGEVPQGADFAVRLQGDSMEPYLRDGGLAYVNRDPLQNGDVGIFCVDGEMLCKQYYRDPLGMVYLFSLNRKRSDADVLLPRDSGRSMVCFGRVILPRRPALPSL